MQQLSVFARLIYISTGVKIKWSYTEKTSRGENKREWGLEQSGVLVTGLFFCSCSLRSFFSASILKVIATASNLPASVSAGSRSVEAASFCFPIAPTTRNLRAVMCVYRPIGLQQSIAFLVKRPFSDTVEQGVWQKPRDAQVWFESWSVLLC